MDHNSIASKSQENIQVQSKIKASSNKLKLAAWIRDINIAIIKIPCNLNIANGTEE